MLSLSKSFLFFISFCLLLGCKSTPQSDDTSPPIVYASFGGSPVDEETERKYTLMEREIEYLMDMWEGDYDNVEQLSFESDRGLKDPSQGQHKRIHSTISKFKNENLGKYLLYVKEYENNDPQNLFREYIYNLTPEDSTAQIRMKIYKFNNESEERELKELSELKMSSLSDVDACDILIHREGRSFIGETASASCGSDILDASSITYHVKVSKNQYGFRFTQNKKIPLEQSINENWYLLDKSRCFVCMIDFPREDGGRPVETKHYIEIHDQGGQFEFDYLDGRHMVLTMRNTWSYGMKRNTFVIALQEDDLKGKVLIYSWGSDGADRIGMNPGWIRVQCDIKNGKNADLQQRLRPDS